MTEPLLAAFEVGVLPMIALSLTLAKGLVEKYCGSYEFLFNMLVFKNTTITNE